MRRSPALAALEVASIARGMRAVDAMLKRADVRVVRAQPMTPGKYVIVLAGAEEEVLESLGAGREVAAAEELDSLLLSGAHEAVLPAIERGVERRLDAGSGSLGILELTTVAATIRATDAALKVADVALVGLALARGIGGKGWVAFEGEQDSVEAALEAGELAVLPDRRAGSELIARPHPELAAAILGPPRAGGDGAIDDD